MSKKSLGIVVGAVLLVAALAVASLGSNQPTERIKIGALLPLTGKLANFGEDIKNSLELVRADIREKDGTDFDIIYEDTGGDAKAALSAAQKLANVDKALIMLTGPGSSVNVAIAPFFEEKKIPFVSISATPNLNNAGQYIFKFIPDISEEVVLIAERLRSEGYGKVSFIYDSSADSNIVGRDVFVAEFKRLGGTDVIVEGYDARTTNDFRDIFTKARAQKPDAIYFLGTDKISGLAIRQAREVGADQKIFGWSPVESEDFLKLAGKAAEGFVITTFKFSCEGDSEMVEFCGSYAAAHSGRKPNHYGAHARDLLVIIGEIARKNKNPQAFSEEVKAALTNHSYDGLTGDIRFDSLGNVVDKGFVFKEVKNGKFVEIN